METANEICHDEYIALFDCRGLSLIRQNRLSKAQSAYVLRQYQKYVETFPKLLAVGISKLDDDESRMPLVANLWDEHGEGDLSKAHRTLYDEMLKKIAETCPSVSGLLAAKYRDAAITFAHNCLNAVASGSASFTMGFLGPGTEGATAELYGVLQNLLVPFGLLDSDIFFGPHCMLDVEHTELFVPAIEAVLRDGGDDRKMDYIAGIRKALKFERDFWDEIADEAGLPAAVTVQ